ncbi:MAG TPA: flagellar export chaperone FliS [Acidimicrobiales bacterium]|nr:flagellar export chaperone FliS [Acidimicrobiales bacterium]
MSANNARSMYMSTAVAGAPPERLLTMLYDALVRNISIAERAMADMDYYTLNTRLVRSQEIVIELMNTLKPELWSGGPALMSIYSYVYRLLVRGNVHKDARALADARKLLEPLQDAWHKAADVVLAQKAGVAAPAGSLAASA